MQTPSMGVNVSQWLKNIGLEQYEGLFRSNDIDGNVLPKLTGDDLKEIGVASLGHRKRLLDAIAALSAADAPAPAHVSAPERRQLTVMFVDLVGSTALSVQLDPEDMRDLIHAYQNALAGEISRFEGHIAQYLGDGVLAYFGWPRAHEDDAERAVRAGLAVIEAVSRLKTPSGASLQTRIGIATGLVVVGDLIAEGMANRHAVVGDTPNLAARLQAIAEPGTIVISEATRDLVGDFFILSDLGRKPLKGISEPVLVFSVAAERALESRFAGRHAGEVAPIVGRKVEFGTLADRWRQASNGEGQIVLLSGEAGIGKSRLTEALIEAVGREPHHLLRCQCSPYHTDSELYPVVQQLLHAARLDEAASMDGRLERLEAVLGGAACSGDALPLIAALLGIEATGRFAPLTLTPQQRRTRTLGVLVEYLAGLAERKPVLWIFEDAHWMDPTSLELIDLALDRLRGARVLSIITLRPGSASPFRTHPAITELALNRLGREATESIVDGLTRGKSLPRLLLDKIVEATDGVPLFIEETTKALLESGMLQQTATGWELNAPLAQLAVPSSLHDSLMSRLDRLQPIAKQLAQTAAVIGREFDRGMLLELSPLAEGELSGALDHLIETGLIYSPDDQPSEHFCFKHALVRDAAYESLLKVNRRAVHLQLLSILSIDPSAAPQVLAHHAQEGGDIGRAARYWRRAAEAAARRYAHREAAALYASAIENAATVGAEARAEMLEACAWENLVNDQVISSIDRYELALKIWKELGRRLEQGRVMSRLSRSYWLRCRGDDARRICHEAVALLENFQDSPEYLEALVEVTRIEMLASNTLEVMDVGSKALTLAKQRGDKRVVAHLLNNMGTTRCQHGDLTDGLGMLEESLKIARENRDQDSIGRFYINAPYQLVEHRRYDQAEQLFEECARIFHAGDDADIYYWQGTAWKTQVDLVRGRWAEAEENAVRELSRFRPSGALPFKIYTLLAITRLSAIRGNAAPYAELQEAIDLAAMTCEPHRIGMTAIVRCEVLWLVEGDSTNILGEMRSTFKWLKELRRQHYVDELGYWLWCLGQATEGIDPASPRGLQVAGRWHEAAAAWRELGCPLEEGQALLQGDRRSVEQASKIFERLGATRYQARAALLASA
jgi:class 3 adenylate cyclase